MTDIAPKSALEPTGRPHAEPAEPQPVKVKVHRGLCMGWGNCHRWAPDLYPLDEEGMVDIERMEVPPEQALDAWLGAGACPERAITVIGQTMEYWFERRRREHRAEEGP